MRSEVHNSNIPIIAENEKKRDWKKRKRLSRLSVEQKAAKDRVEKVGRASITSPKTQI